MLRASIKQPGGLDNIVFSQHDVPEPKAGEVLVRWKASSLNFHDFLVANGSIPVPEGRVPMSDGAGLVAAVGEGVTQWQAGDEVMSLFFPNWTSGEPNKSTTSAISGETVDGFAQEYSCVGQNAITRIPKDYTFAEAATLPCAALTAWRALVPVGNIKAGDKVVIQGSGGMSIFGLQLAKAAGAFVIATTSSDAKAVRMKELGADEVLNYKEDEQWGRTIAKATGGVDHILDVGGPATLEQAVEAVGFGGQITLIGILGGRKGQFVLPKLFFKHASMNGIAVGSRSMQEDMVKAIEVADFKPVIDSGYDLTDLKSAFEHQASGKHFGKIVLEF